MISGETAAINVRWEQPITDQVNRDDTRVQEKLNYTRSGIVSWNNEGGVNSPIVGAFPAQDTAIMDPPTWYTAIPATMSVDGRLPLLGYFLAGLWAPDAQSAPAPGSAVIAHGNSNAGAARLTIFAMNPLYRADPEREWAMLASATYWADQ